MREPLVSVVVTLYNKERYIEECLQSILAQTYSRLEIVVVDDHSTDGSVEQVRRMTDPRIHLVCRDANSGLPGVVRNQGMRLAQGEYLAFLDADDVWEPGKLAVQVAFMEAHPEYPFTHTQCMVVDADGKEMYLRNHGRYPPDGDCFAELIKKCFICTSTVMIRRPLIEQIGYFPEDRHFRCGEDWEYYLRCARDHAIGMPVGVLAQYRWCEDSTFHHPESWNSVSCRAFLDREDLWGGKMTRDEVKRIALDEADTQAFRWREKRGFGKAAWFAWHMIRLEPASPRGWKHLMAAAMRRS